MRIPFEEITLEAVQGKYLRAILHRPDEAPNAGAAPPNTFDADLQVDEVVDGPEGTKIIRCGVQRETVILTSKRGDTKGQEREEVLDRAQVEYGVASGGWIEVDDAG